MSIFEVDNIKNNPKCCSPQVRETRRQVVVVGFLRGGNGFGGIHTRSRAVRYNCGQVYFIILYTYRYSTKKIDFLTRYQLRISIFDFQLTLKFWTIPFIYHTIFFMQILKLHVWYIFRRRHVHSMGWWVWR